MPLHRHHAKIVQMGNTVQAREVAHALHVLPAVKVNQESVTSLDLMRAQFARQGHTIQIQMGAMLDALPVLHAAKVPIEVDASLPPKACVYCVLQESIRTQREHILLSASIAPTESINICLGNPLASIVPLVNTRMSEEQKHPNAKLVIWVVSRTSLGPQIVHFVRRANLHWEKAKLRVNFVRKGDMEHRRDCLRV
jgi:hypothetical protein